MASIVLNLWGGESYLAGAAMLAMGAVGMFEPLDSDLFYSVLDSQDGSKDATRLNELQEAYRLYCEMTEIKQNDEKLHPTGVKLSQIQNFPEGNTEPTLQQKYPGLKEYLAFGFKETDTKLNIKTGIYGAPWIGKAYFKDTDFSLLYSKINEEPKAVINCGGYKGGGTATTFIPLSAKYALKAYPNAKVYTVVAGPSTTFATKVEIEGLSKACPEYKNAKDWIDLFEIPALYQKMVAYKSDDPVTKKLEQKLRETIIPNENENYEHLNPQYYMSRFIEQIETDDSLSQTVNFVFLKPNLTSDQDGNLLYDVTSPGFSKDSQKHDLHITNLLNALTVYRICEKQGDLHLQVGQIYSSGTNADFFTIETMMDADQQDKFYQFLVFSILMVFYIYRNFKNPRLPAGDALRKKWFKNETWGPFTNKAAEAENNQFAGQIEEYLRNLIWAYNTKVLTAFKEIHDTNSETRIYTDEKIDIFDEGVYQIVEDLLKRVKINNEKGMVEINANAGEDEHMLRELITRVAAILSVWRKSNYETVYHEINPESHNMKLVTVLCENIPNYKGTSVTDIEDYSRKLAKAVYDFSGKLKNNINDK